MQSFDKQETELLFDIRSFQESKPLPRMGRMSEIGLCINQT